jgi:high affinity Mn2+ porin
MSAQGEEGDIGLSRYPPAEGERGSDRGTRMESDTAPSDTGVSRNPPAEGERNVPPEEGEPPPRTAPSENNRLPRLPEPMIPEMSPETAGSTGLGPTGGIAGFFDGEITRVDITDLATERAPPSPSLAVAFSGQQDNASQRPGDTGVSRYPPAEGARGSPSELQGPRARPIGTISERQGDTGVSRYPPAEGERGDLSAITEPVDAWYSAHEQATAVTMVHNVFPSPYKGKLSLRPSEPAANTLTGTVFFAARLWETERHDTQLIFNPEIAGGGGFSGTDGIAGFPNGEATRVGVPNPTPYIARLYLRQTFGFGGERENAPDDVNEVAGQRDVRRLAVIVGKFAAPDIADDNHYSHDPRTQFLNWALVYNGAWDYPANVRGYTYGVALDYNHSKDWSVSYAVFTVPLFANGAPLDWNLLKAQGQVAELERRYEINGRPGAFRPLAFLNHAHMGDYNEALQLMPVDPDITKTRSYRYKYGFGLSIDQELTDDIGFFSRLGWNDGHTETWAFTEIDRTATAGLVMGGRWWCRPYDRVGLAGILNGLSGPHERYLAAGGYGFIIGDGKLNYGLEQILEWYYAYQVKPGLIVTLDFQEVVNPAYNRDRGPVQIIGLRVHWDR